MAQTTHPPVFPKLRVVPATEVKPLRGEDIRHHESKKTSVVEEPPADPSNEGEKQEADPVTEGKQKVMERSVIEHLRLQLANAWVLYANLKHYHWQTFGPLFRDTHLMFEEFAGAVFDTIDDLAERIRMLGEDVDLIQLKQYQDNAAVSSSAAGQSVKDMVEEAHANAGTVIKDMRAAAWQADKESDPGSVDLFSKLVQVHEKQEWFLRQMLQGKDGMVG